MDFYKIRMKHVKKDLVSIFPDFQVGDLKDLMVRGHKFYAVYNENTKFWIRDEKYVQLLIDRDLSEFYIQHKDDEPGVEYSVEYTRSYGSKSWRTYAAYIHDSPDNYHPLDEELVFANTELTRESYATKTLPYFLQEGPCDAYEEIMSTLYNETEREKIEWAIGAVLCGDSKVIQKFVVLYGSAGSGKSTVLNIIQLLFDGYYTMFEAKELASRNNSFSTEAFRDNPLVAIQHDGDLSNIEDNSKLNSIISHEEMVINEKFKPTYTSRINAFLFMATNSPVKITDSKSGILRRLIDVNPSGRLLEAHRYKELIDRVKFELPGIAWHCLQVYERLGIHYYDSYKPVSMMFRTDMFFNFVEDSRTIFERQNGVTLKQAYDMYRQYCEESSITRMLPKYKFRDELQNYFREFYAQKKIDGENLKNVFIGLITDKFEIAAGRVDETGYFKPHYLQLDTSESLLDIFLEDCPAQYATENETPQKKWDNVATKLRDIDTKKLHYVKPPLKLIVIDFDLKDENGEKSRDLNLEAAAKWPSTYAEFSKGGAGVHLHYIYDGDPEKLSRVYSEGIEIKVFSGGSALRRRVSLCNMIPVAHISSGLPLKGEKVINFTSVRSEKSLRNLIERNLRKEIHPGTKPSVDFIYKILEDAYDSGLNYDVTDMRPAIFTFANNSTHQGDYCIDLVNKMKFKSEDYSEPESDYDDDRLVFFDVEVFPNLFLVNWKYDGADSSCIRMINPTSEDIEKLFSFRLVGFNCRRYDNHILYARYLGYSNIELYELSQRIISGSRNGMFSEAYNISYTDVYDFASAGHKQSLKKFEIELGIHHQELGLPWDQPVPEDRWLEVAEYCDNDVIATEAVFNYLSGDWAARQILAKLSGLSVNDTTNQHSTRIIFGTNRHPQSQFVYTDLSEMFPGYSFERGKSSYRGENPGEGGYVYAEEGMYENVGLFDVASMHPSSIEALNLFGDRYTKVFSDIKNARLCIKHKDYDGAEKLLDGKLTPFVEELRSGTATYSNVDLANALKTVINSVYGLTSAKFENAFKDPRNKDNIVAKRGALFMIDLKKACQEKGWTVVHIKTDSIKLADCTQEMEDFVLEFGKKYGYSFEHEATYDRMCIVNDAVYIAKDARDGHWTATGAQFQHPYVFKALFSGEPIEFKDMCETKSVTSAIYLDMNEGLPEGEHSYSFVGKVGQFCPIKPGCGGGVLVREKDGKYYAVTGTKRPKGSDVPVYRWLESEVVKQLGKENDIDLAYFRQLCDAAIDQISKYGDYEWFVSNE